MTNLYHAPGGAFRDSQHEPPKPDPFAIPWKTITTGISVGFMSLAPILTISFGMQRCEANAVVQHEIEVEERAMCVDFCHQAHFQFWQYVPVWNDTQVDFECFCAQPSRHIRHNFMCNVQGDEPVCIYF